MRTLITNIKQLVNTREENKLLRGAQLSELPCIDDAFILIEDDRISEFGKMYDLTSLVPSIPQAVVDAAGKFVLPCWCDSHSHIVFAGSREAEFVDKINGLGYAEIAAKGGGILNSSSKLNAMDEDELFERSMERLHEVQRMGTGAIEIKSGYGLSVEGELKMLRTIKRMKENSGMLIKSTFLGAHTFPLIYRENREGYISMIINDMLPVIAEEGLADYVDVFCEKGFFTAEETEKICNAGARFGLKPKLHVNQLNSIGGVETGIRCNSVSLDHLETLTSEEIALLGSYSGVSTLLPTAAFFLRMNYQPARDLINAGAAVALASDYNPGSSPSGNMNFVNALSCIQMKMLPEEVINASTINGAFAMEVQEEAGSISIGKKANLIITKEMSSLPYMFYAFGTNHIDGVMINGLFIN